MKSVAIGIVLLLSMTTIAFAQSGKVESLGAVTDASVPESVRAALDSKGYRVILDDGSVACELWFGKAVPAQTKKDVPGAIYPELAESTFVGLLRFPQSGSDYRGQSIATGYYTLRYELLPNDGNHLGAAANRDFLLLVPVASDGDPGAALKTADVIDRSRKAAGSRHPAALSLVSPEKAGAPSVSKGEEDHWIFSAQVKLVSGEEIPLALVVKGQAQQ